MTSLLRFCIVAVLLIPTVGCAGGWRDGSPVGLAATASTPAAVKAAAPSSKTTSARTTSVTAEGVTFVYTGPAKSVNVAGEFNAWSTSADPMAKQSDGSWRLVKAMPAGRYPYKFVIDGTEWKADTGAPEGVDDGFGGKNSLVVVGAAGAPAAIVVSTPNVAAPTAMTNGDGATFRYSGAATSVHLAGEFNAWSTSADALVKQADGTWAITKKLASGRYAYKFVVDGGTWKEDPTAKETIDDGFGGKNAIMVVGAGAASAAPPVTAAPVAPTAGAVAASTTGDGATFRFSGAATSVHLAGEFNAWSTSADALAKQADGTWAITKKLAAGRYAYKFVVDGGTWKEDPAAKETVDDGFGGKNAIMVVGAGSAAVAPTVTTAPSAAAVASPARAVTGKAKAPQLTSTGVVFTYAGTGNTVALCGDFNNWAAGADAMKQAPDGTWTLTKKLAAGSYGYKFLVNGSTWKTDEANPASKDDGFGGKNSLVTIK